ncbi:MAG TPA: AAA family ATPase [Aquificales bacterium]|nr:AAA family ATPase [Aquificales bacterium]
MLTVGHGRQKRFLEKSHLQGRVASAYAFIGREGIGKKLLALEFARGLLCKNYQPFGCGECKSCRLVDNFIKSLREGETDKFAYHTTDEGGKKHFAFLIGEHPDLILVPPDGNQIKIDQIRELQEYVALKPTGRHKVVIIDDAGKMNPQAQNALLKTLEEPPQGVVFILIATNRGELLPTILSRCQVVEFQPLKGEEVEEVLTSVGRDIPQTLRELAKSKGSLAVLRLTEEGEAVGEMLALLGDPKALTYGEIIDLSEEFEKLPTEGRETFLNLLEELLTDKLLRGEIDTKTFEGASRYISETKRGLKRGIKPKLAMENILLTLKG